ncbi:MAG: FadR/GntR family transcriptional regulator [Nocardioidaceae bacterium]
MARRTRGLHGTLVDELGRAIVLGSIAVGEVLVPEELCHQFSASRPTVREALRVLESKGMLSIRPNSGTKVQPSDKWQALDPELVWWRWEAGDRAAQERELAQLRLAVEPVAARLAAKNSPDRVRDELGTAWEAMQTAAREHDVRAFTDADMAFHACLLSASGNAMFNKLSELTAVSLEVRETDLISHHADISPAAVAGHRKVYTAVRGGHSARAETAMRALLTPLANDLELRSARESEADQPA